MELTEHRRRSGPGADELASGFEEAVVEALGADERLALLEAEFAVLRTRRDLLTQGLDIGVWDWNMETNETWWSPRLYDLLGYEDGGIEAGVASYTRHMDADDVATLTRLLDRHFAGGPPYDFTYQVTTADGRRRWIRAVGVAEFTASGKPRRMVGANIDVDDEVRAAQALDEASTTLVEAGRLVDELLSGLTGDDGADATPTEIRQGLEAVQRLLGRSVDTDPSASSVSGPSASGPAGA